jgi:hypothetical protein
VINELQDFILTTLSIVCILTTSSPLNVCLYGQTFASWASHLRPHPNAGQTPGTEAERDAVLRYRGSDKPEWRK